MQEDHPHLREHVPTDAMPTVSRDDGGPAPSTPAAKRPATLMLIAVAAVSPLGINMYLPSMPGMARSLGVDFATIQLTLSVYLGAVALGQLIIGPLSDRFGRRPVLMIGLGLFVLGSLICLVAPNVGVLLFGRVVQAVGGCAGIVLSRAIVRDLYDRNRAASMIGYVTMGMAVAPMVAPTIGGLLDALYGWRASFVFLATFGSLTLLATVWRLHETNHNRAAHGAVRAFLAGYAAIIRSRAFWGYTLTTGFSSAIFFAFISGASYVMIELMQRSPAEYGMYFATVSSGYLVGNFISGRFAARFGPNRMIVSGTIIASLAIGVMAALFALGAMHPLALFLPMFFVGAANGFVLPSGIAGAVSVRPDVAGAAAGLSGSCQIGFGALITPIVGAMLDTNVWPLIVIMGICALAALLCYHFVMPRAARLPVH